MAEQAREVAGAAAWSAACGGGASSPRPTTGVALAHPEPARRSATRSTTPSSRRCKTALRRGRRGPARCGSWRCAGAGKDFCSGADLAVAAGDRRGLGDGEPGGRGRARGALPPPAAAAEAGGGAGARAGAGGRVRARDRVRPGAGRQSRRSFGYPEVRIGFVPGDGDGDPAAERLGEARLRADRAAAATLPAAEAERIGLVNRVFPDAEFEEGCRAPTWRAGGAQRRRRCSSASASSTTRTRWASRPRSARAPT